MSIIKNEIPILEFDSDRSAVIEPTHEKLELSLPERCVFAFLGDYIDVFAAKNNAKKLGEFVSTTKSYPVYLYKHKGEDICLCQAPMSSAAAAQLLDWLIGYGVRKAVSTGSCGALESFDEGVFLVPYRALRDEGASYHYVAPSRFIDISPNVRRAICEALTERGIKLREVTTWTTDGFYRETREKVAYRKSEGCAVVEMECSALAAVAKARGVEWGSILYTADSLANVDKYDERNWGGDVEAYALSLCLDAVVKI